MPAFIIANEAQALARTLYEQLNTETEFYLLLPCSSEILAQHLTSNNTLPARPSLPQLLSQLTIPAHKAGFQQLLAAIDLFAKDPGQSLSKELYPAVAKKLGFEDWKSVEHSIRRAILTGWQHRDPITWERFFPESKKPPSNKAFIALLARQLD